MSRGVFLLGVGLVLVTLALLLTDRLFYNTPGVCERNVRRIREGMALVEVERILGGPAGSTLPGQMRRDGTVTQWARYWIVPQGIACVLFDASERAEGASFDPEELPGEGSGPLHALRSSLGW